MPKRSRCYWSNGELRRSFEPERNTVFRRENNKLEKKSGEPEMKNDGSEKRNGGPERNRTLGPEKKPWKKSGNPGRGRNSSGHGSLTKEGLEKKKMGADGRRPMKTDFSSLILLMLLPGAWLVPKESHSGRKSNEVEIARPESKTFLA